MKDTKFRELVVLVEEMIAEHELRNPHYLRDDEIIKVFETIYKKKHIKRAIQEVR